MTSPVTNTGKAAALIALALAIGAMGIYVADADDAPGAAALPSRTKEPLATPPLQSQAAYRLST